MIFDRRRVVHFLAMTCLALPARAAAKSCPTKVLFVCPMGSVKSAIAREELRRLVKQRGLPVEVESRGLTPANDISPALAAHLKAESINPLADPLRRFTPADAARADITVAFDEAAEAPGLGGARVWHSLSWNDDYFHAKAAMDRHIAEFADELSKRPCSRIPQAR